MQLVGLLPRDITTMAIYDRHGGQDQNIPSDRDSRNSGSSFDKMPTTSPKKTFSVERIQDMSLAAIKEFYTVEKMRRKWLCALMSSILLASTPLWVTDSFEWKDMQRDLLTRLLIYSTFQSLLQAF
ncbi:hypothetical protein QQ045_014056 [Rhodiola kirilowii]